METMYWDRHTVAAFLAPTGSLRVALLSVSVVVLFVAHRWRVRVVEDRLRRVLAERIAERERLSRQVNDTLLQGMQGLILLFQGLAVQIPTEIPIASQLESALDRAERLMVEARDGLPGLSASDGPSDSGLAGPLRSLNAEGVAAIFQRIFRKAGRK